MSTTHQIGSGRPLFELPGNRFINATKPLTLISLKAKTKDSTDDRTSTADRRNAR